MFVSSSLKRKREIYHSDFTARQDISLAFLSDLCSVFYGKMDDVNLD